MMFKFKAIGGSITVIPLMVAVTSWYASPIPKDVALIVPDLGFDKLLTPSPQRPAAPACSQQDLDGWQLVQAPDANSHQATLYSPSQGARMLSVGQDLGHGLVMQSITPHSITLACRESGIQRMVGYITPSATAAPINPNGN